MTDSKRDWKLFCKKIGGWQGSCIERLVQEYIEYLSSDQAASEKFWGLEKKIKNDKRRPGVLIRLDKSEMEWDLSMLIRDGVITMDDPEGFTDETKEIVQLYLSR